MKSKTLAYVLWFFLGSFSMHRFYLGKLGSGLIYLFTAQLFTIGWFVDFFMLSGMVDAYNNKKRIEDLERAQMADARRTLTDPNYVPSRK